MKKNDVITKDITIEEIVNNYPELIRPLMQNGIKCIVCGEPIWGTLEDNAKEKGIVNLDDIIHEMNEIVKEKRESEREHKAIH